MEEVVFSRLEPDASAQLVSCVRRCYGDTYPTPWFYDSARLAEKLASGRLLSSVARTQSGRVVAHMGLVLRRAGDNTGDAGTTLVDPEFRGRGLMKGVGVQLARACKEAGLVGFHDYPITVHAATQRLGVGVPSGLMLDHLPAEVDFSEMEGLDEGERTASLVRYHPITEAPARSVFLPAWLVDHARELYAALRLQRELGASAGRLAGESELEEGLAEERGLLRLVVKRAGADLRERVAEVLRQPAAVAQVDLSMSRDETPVAVEVLGGLGFFYAAILPEFADGDVLRLQRLADPLREPKIPVLEGEAAARVRDLVFAQRKAIPKRS